MSIGLAKNSRKPLYCSFCGKSDDDVGYLVAGPSVFICNECVQLCKEIGEHMLTVPHKCPETVARLTTTAATSGDRATGDWRLVPVEPTEAMKESACMVCGDLGHADARLVYVAMLAAAPGVSEKFKTRKSADPTCYDAPVRSKQESKMQDKNLGERPWAFAKRKGFKGIAPGLYYHYFATEKDAKQAARLMDEDGLWHGPIEYRPGECRALGYV